MQSFSQNFQTNFRKCGIVGVGNVGSTVAYTLMQTGWFSEMVLLDINTKKAHGEASDLSHSLPFHAPMDIYAGTYTDLADCGIIVLTAGANRLPDQSRLAPAKTNAQIFRSIVNNISIYNQNAILLVVTNPVDILTYVAYQASDYPPSRVIGSGTVLDTARLKQLLGKELEVDSRQIHAFIIGEHGDSELPVWSSANVSGIDLPHFCQLHGHGDDADTLHQLFLRAKNSAREILEAKGATYYAIAESVKRIISAIIRDENSILPVSTLATGHYGLDDVCLSLPCILNRHGVAHILEIPLSNEEHARLQLSAQTLKKVIRDL